MIIFTLPFLTACDKTTSAETLYNYGKDIILLLDRTIKNTDFQKLMNDDFSNYIAYDYDTPIDVYQITGPDYSKYTISEDDQDYENYLLYLNLPEEIQEQIKNKTATFTAITMNTISYFNMINDDGIFFPIIKKYDGKINERINYLYTFETGKPILVTFQPYNNKILTTATFLNTDQFTSLSNIREFYLDVLCDVEKLYI